MVPESQGGWKNVVAPSGLAFSEDYPLPRALSVDGIKSIVSAFAAAAAVPGMQASGSLKFTVLMDT